MRKTIVVLLPLILMVILSLACFGSFSNKAPEAAAVTPLTSPDLQATIDSAVQATCVVRSDVLAEADSLSKTATAIALTCQPVATPTPVEAIETLSEDRLGALINDRVQMAMKAAALAASTATEAVANGTITAKELDLLTTYWHYSDDLVAYADEGIVVYFKTYADLAADTITPLQTVDADMQTISRETQAIFPVLEQIGQAQDQNIAPTSQALSQLESAAKIVQSKAADAQGQAQGWAADLQSMAQKRIARALAVKPQRVAKTRKAAINKAHDYVGAVQAALADQKITQAEMATIAQLGANTAASLTKKGGEQLASLSSSVNQITTQIAGGQNSAAKNGVESFQAALPAKP